MRGARAALIVAALTVVAATNAHSQRSATGVRDLAFGAVLPGVPTNVLPNDIARSGQFEIRGQFDDPVEITFSLPSVLNGPGAASMPVSFGTMSAGFSTSGSVTNQVFFDPRVPFRINLSSTGQGSGFIGGVLSPSGTQPAGSYAASVTITVAFLGQ
jgi:hypothetical protein